MNIPDWMPIWRSRDQIRQQWLYAVVALDGSYGLATMFGRAEDPAQILMRSIMPMFWWGCAWLAAALLILFGASVTGGILGLCTWMSQGFVAVVTIDLGTSLSFNDPIPLMFLAGIHGLIIYEVGTGIDADRERRQRASE